MCGIVGYVGSKNALNVLIDGLSTLEYRGYDSSGVAFFNSGRINIIKEKGKIKELQNLIDFRLESNIGIGHTRWATHGVPSVINSHPHQVGRITLVHNGIIENYEELKKELLDVGYRFSSETDSEVACAYIDYIYKRERDILKTLNFVTKIIEGSYAFGIICEDDPDTLYALRKDSPLIVGLGKDENYIASDVPAILKYTKDYYLIDNNEVAVIKNNSILFYKDDICIEKVVNVFKWSLEASMKNGFEHFMLKEIYEQPAIIAETFKDININNLNKFLKETPILDFYESIDIVACGSATHASLIGKWLLENYANIKVNVETASEYRYKKLFLNDKSLVIVVSQSGETADSLAAVRKAKEMGAYVLGIINVLGSSIAREADQVIYTKAGCEIAVATTKAYTAQVSVFVMLALASMIRNDIVDDNELVSIIKELSSFEDIMKRTLEIDIKKISKMIFEKENMFFVGRSIDYALAMEGSLKLKEISYIHSEAYAAGELKHGTISLIEEGTPVIAIITDQSLASKTISNVKELKARGAFVIAIITDSLDRESDFYDEKIIIPKTNPILQSLITILPIQLLSYEIAHLRGCDIDKPRNLAKSVTVE